VSRSDPPDGSADPGRPDTRIAGARYGRYLVILAAIALVAITVNTALTPPNGAKGIPSGERVPPFAAPLALGTLPGDVNVATHPYEGGAGRRPACTVRGTQILNVCQLYEQGPLVLALFVDGGSCADILRDMQVLVPSFPEVRFAAVAIKGDTGALRRLVRSRGLTFPVGIDRDGILAGLYKLSTCPQVTFAYPGGVVQSAALLSRPPLATLRARVTALLAASRARGWRPAQTRGGA
jgi:hypothetical protein